MAEEKAYLSGWGVLFFSALRCGSQKVCGRTTGDHPLASFSAQSLVSFSSLLQQVAFCAGALTVSIPLNSIQYISSDSRHPAGELPAHHQSGPWHPRRWLSTHQLRPVASNRQSPVDQFGPWAVFSGSDYTLSKV